MPELGKLHRRRSCRFKMTSTTREEDRELARLRVNIQDVTESIIDLIGARQKLSQQVALVKRKRGLPIENLSVEAKLGEQVAKYAKRRGVEESLAMDILARIVDSSKVVQRELFYAQSISDFLKLQQVRTVGIIGAGRMGGWFAAYFKALVPRILIYDSDSEKAERLASRLAIPRKRPNNEGRDLKWVFENSDLLIICVPIGETVTLIRKLVAMRKEGGAKRPLRIMEITSVKAPIVESGLLRRSKNHDNNNDDGDGQIQLISIHPLFGPDAKSFGLNLVIDANSNTSKKNNPESVFVRKLFPHYDILKLRPEEHDRAMSYILALPHLLALAFAKIISQNSAIQREITMGLRGPSFARMVELAGRVLSENPNVYFEIQSMNRHNARLVVELQETLSDLKERRKNKARFRQVFADARKHRVFQVS